MNGSYLSKQLKRSIPHYKAKEKEREYDFLNDKTLKPKSWNIFLEAKELKDLSRTIETQYSTLYTRPVKATRNGNTWFSKSQNT